MSGELTGSWTLLLLLLLLPAEAKVSPVSNWTLLDLDLLLWLSDIVLLVRSASSSSDESAKEVNLGSGLMIRLAVANDWVLFGSWRWL